MKKMLAISLLFTLCGYSQNMDIHTTCIMQDSSKPIGKEIWYLTLAIREKDGKTKTAGELATIPLIKGSGNSYLCPYTITLEYDDTSGKCPDKMTFDKASGIMNLRIGYSGCEAHYSITMHVTPNTEMPGIVTWDVDDIKAKYIDNMEKREVTLLLDTSDKSLDVTFKNDILTNRSTKTPNPK